MVLNHDVNWGIIGFAFQYEETDCNTFQNLSIIFCDVVMCDCHSLDH